jgi:hypothetical protein
VEVVKGEMGNMEETTPVLVTVFGNLQAEALQPCG